MEGGVRRKRAVCWLPNEQVEGWSVSINVSIGRVSLFGNERESYLVLDNNRGTCLKPARHKSEGKKEMHIRERAEREVDLSITGIGNDKIDQQPGLIGLALCVCFPCDGCRYYSSNQDDSLCNHSHRHP
jgi:hypothetical protein